MLLKSIKFQVLAILLLQLVALLGVVASTLYLINLRQHDYLILNLTGQLRVITRSLVTQSNHYLDQAPRDYKSYNRDLGLYNKDLQKQVEEFDRIIQSLRARRIDAGLLSQQVILPESNKSSAPSISGSTYFPGQNIICKWDQPSRDQLAETADTWDQFRGGLTEALGNDDDGPRLEAAAQFILLNEQTLTLSTAELANNFRAMMESKLQQIKILNQAGIVILIVIGIIIILILYYRVFRPIDRTVAGFNRVAYGELGYQVPVYDKSEIGVMTETFNRLTLRLSTLFRLTDRINQANDLDETLRFVYEEFPVFLPVNWVGVLRTSRNKMEYYLDRYYSEDSFNISPHENFLTTDTVFSRTVESQNPFCSCMALSENEGWQADAFIKRLLENNFKSVFYLPLLTNPLDTAVLVIASSKTEAYDAQHLEFLGNIAGQVGNSFEKTIGMENLVISTVKGLAKLAESRDPETGDHLFRMSHYSALVAEELGKTEKYQDVITTHYVRNILKFAPMHDIGKVGIADAILLKPGKLTDEEFTEMQQHPTIGAEVLRRCEAQMNAAGRSVFQVGIQIAEGHHEKFNGRGYPEKLQGDDIPLAARIVAVADVFDALTSKRPYKEAWPVEKALDLLKEESGQHFDPAVVEAFILALPKVMEIYNKFKHI